MKYTSEDVGAAVLYLSVIVIAVASVVQASCLSYIIYKLTVGP